MEGLGTEVGNNEYSLYPLLKVHASTFLSFSQKLKYLKSVTKVWNLPAENQMILLLPTAVWHQRMRKYVKCYKQEWFYNAELLCEETGNYF
jgi:hypothetical protein